MGYVVPFLPPSSRTVRLIWIPLEQETELVRRARQIISEHSGPRRSLSLEPLTEEDDAHLRRFGLTLDQSACVQFRSDTDQFTTCPMTRQNAKGE